MPNPCLKSRKIEQPYASFTLGEIEYHVLKVNSMQSPRTNPFASAMLAGRGPGTFGGWDMGDMYLTATIDHPRARYTFKSPEFEAYLAGRK